MVMATRHDIYRISGIRPWASEGTNEVPLPLRTFFEGKEVGMDDLRALVASFDAEFVSAVEGAARYQATISWRGQRYDLDLEPL
jgi:hypothetical protein